MKKRRLFAVGIVAALLGLGAGTWWAVAYLEGSQPEIRFGQEVQAIGRQKNVDISCTDEGSGLRSVRVTVTQDNKPIVLHTADYPARGVRSAAFSVAVEPAKLRLHDGPASLEVVVVDHSLRKNEARVAKPVQIRLAPPQIFPLNPTNILNPGGVGVTVWRTSEGVVETGVALRDLVFPGRDILIGGKSHKIAYFAIPMDAKTRGMTLQITARDAAENRSSTAVPFTIRDKKFRSDKMPLSEGFLQRKMPEFLGFAGAPQGKSLVEVFVWVNTTLRAENNRTIRELCRSSEDRPLWKDAFLRMKNASPMALFGDHRTYVWNNRVVGESMHEGIDLASTENAPIEAANGGRVVFAGALGIYGNAVLIDHGLGLFTLYGHLASLNVAKGQAVEKGGLLGRSGATGLAGGDHLHFGMIAGGQFVNPIEWWDPHWIADNVEKKLLVS